MGLGNGNAPPQVRDKRGEFLKGHPPVFKHSTNPLHADDWLRAIERQLEIAYAFRSHHVPAGLMKLKKKEFLALKQGSMTIAEYHDKFIQLSWYAPTEVDEDEKRHELFMEGLNGGLQYQLLSHTFASFQQLVDKALVIENKCHQMEDKKRKFQGQQSRSNSRFHANPQ
ncbi:uncharacterized protein [Miscanthus floridulus]|uniref:uncharacterized protein n=1 Tax=Miscanthus floridulus TaxID=154761 RepID=UPI003459C7BB